MYNPIDVSVLIGQTITAITAAKPGDDEIHIFTEEGRHYHMYHMQHCCESVTIESIVGDLNDLLNTPILIAEMVTGDTPNDYKFEYEPASYTWTFYKFATVKGYVDIRWLGESNGYYGEEVDFEEITQ